MPLFLSFFIGLRRMANLPVGSLRDGGMLWFTDLTVPDQYFALPIVTSLTLWATIEVSMEVNLEKIKTICFSLERIQPNFHPKTYKL